MKNENKKLDISLNSLEPLIQKISDLTKIQRILLSCLLVAVIVGGFVYFLYMPNFEQISKLQKDIVEQEKTLKETKKNADQYAEYKKKMEDAQAKFNIAAKALPEKDEVPSLLTSISMVGNEAGLEFLLFKPEAEVLKDFYAELPITMQLSGSYHDLGMFFDQLAGMPRIVNINKFEINSDAKSIKSKVTIKGKGKGKAGSEEEGTLFISCTAETYKFVEVMPEATEEDAKGKKGKKSNAKKTKK
ncbi:MAG: protein PilO [Desulfobacteraceae bacterium]|nr:MAG: protein PilO [Desulfobacteraceae bacterium]